MLKKAWTRVGVMLVLVLVLFLQLTLPVLAISADEAIIDEPTVFSETETQELMDAIDSIADRVGADVKVVVLSMMGEYSSLDHCNKSNG